MAQVKVSYKFNPSPYPYIMKNGRPKRGNYCRECGRPLKDAESIARGYGPECWLSIPVILVLDVQAVEHCLHTDAGESADLQAVSNASAESTSQEDS